MQKGQAHVNAWKVVGMSVERSNACKRVEGGRDECRKVKYAEARVNAQKVVGMSAERSNTRKHAEGGGDQCRKVNQSELA